MEPKDIIRQIRTHINQAEITRNPYEFIEARKLLNTLEDDRRMDHTPADNPGLSLSEQYPDEFEPAEPSGDIQPHPWHGWGCECRYCVSD